MQNKLGISQWFLDQVDWDRRSIPRRHQEGILSVAVEAGYRLNDEGSLVAGDCGWAANFAFHTLGVDDDHIISYHAETVGVLKQGHKICLRHLVDTQ